MRIYEEGATTKLPFLNSPNMTTTAVVLAAGLGTRLRSNIGEPPKPLTLVAGIPIIRRVMHSAKQGGITKFVVVVGFESEQIITTIKGDPELSQVTTFVYNENWNLPNGVSVACSQNEIGTAPFVLLMGDHLFDPKIVERLRRIQPPSSGALLAVDINIKNTFDIDDATKVYVEDNSIIQIGKELKRFNAIDTGIFHCSQGIFQALKMAGPTPSLSEGVQILASLDRMKVVEIGNSWWQDIDTTAMLKNGERLLYKSLRKNTDGIISKNINRPISLFVTKKILPFKPTPNVITYIVLIIGLVSALFVATGTTTNLLIGGLLFQLCSILDGCDGEIAKLTYTSSYNGAWLDTICDNITYLACVGAISLGIYNRTGSLALLGVGISDVLLLILFLGISYTWLTEKGKSGSLLALQSAVHIQLDSFKGSWIAKLIKRIQFIGKRDFFAFLFCILSLFNQLGIMFLILTLIIHVSFWTTISLKTKLASTESPAVRGT